jgi:hypothetical protein
MAATGGRAALEDPRREDVARYLQPREVMVHRRSCAQFAVALLLALDPVVAAALDPVGSGSLRGQGSLAVQRCGRARLHSVATVSVASDGTWIAATDDGATFGGSWSAIGTNGRQFDLAFDAASEAGFLRTLASDASELCDAPIVVTSAVREKFLLTFHRKGSRATLVLRYAATGSAGGRTGSARSRLKLSGRWS